MRCGAGGFHHSKRQSGSYTISRPKTDDSHVTRNHLNDEIAMIMAAGGRNHCDTRYFYRRFAGYQTGNFIARSMVTEWGMSEEISNTYYGGEQEVFIGRDYQTQASFSEKTAAIIDNEIKKILDYNYQRALDVLRKNEPMLHNIVKLLFEKDTIYGMSWI
jgi:cell division protease FtsH